MTCFIRSGSIKRIFGRFLLQRFIFFQAASGLMVSCYLICCSWRDMKDKTTITNAVYRFSGLGEIKVYFWEENKWVFSLQVLIACPILITESSEQQPYLAWTEGLKRGLWCRKVKSYQVAAANIHLTKWCNTDLLRAFHHSLDLEQMKCTGCIYSAHTISDLFHNLLSSLSFFQGHMAAFLAAPQPSFPVYGLWAWWLMKIMRFMLSGSQTKSLHIKKLGHN